MPKILGSSIEEHRQQVRERVFDAFATLLHERGYDAITLADLAAAAGIGRTVIYNHFPDKDAVVVAFAASETSRHLTRLHLALTGIDDPVLRLRSYVRHHLAAADDFHLGLGHELYAMLSHESLGEIRQHVHQVEGVLGEILSDGMDRGDFTRIDLASAVSLVHACLQARHASAEVVEAFVLRGVEARTS